ncbi:MAG: hypothetical protein ACREC5_08105 [Thermoplasmata archaeon]
MALFSDVDWLVLLAVAAFLLFGSQGRDFVRQMGRLYGRAMRLKTELMNEITQSTGLPSGGAGSIRQALLGPDAPAAAAPLAGAAVGYRPADLNPGIVTQVCPVSIRTVETLAYGAAMGPGMWSVATTNFPGEAVRIQ